MNLYVTADRIGIETGGGSVTFHESEALKTIGPCEVWDHSVLDRDGFVTWKYDTEAKAKARHRWGIGAVRRPGDPPLPDLMHFYAGTFSKTIEAFKFNKGLVTYTAAAHDITKSKKAHEELGIPFDYPHLTDMNQWSRYLLGYQLADVLIVPSYHSRSVMMSYGCTNRIEVIPHGCHLPEQVKSLPNKFTVGYLGAYGPDKGVRFLIEAWRELNYADAKLILGGRDSQSEWVKQLIIAFGGRSNIECVGWVDNVSDFYNECSLYVQPSVTEGFGMEVLEACAHARPVIVSTDTGAECLIPEGWKFDPYDVKELAEKIDSVRRITMKTDFDFFLRFREIASRHTWDRIRQRYVDLWRSLLKQGVK